MIVASSQKKVIKRKKLVWKRVNRPTKIYWERLTQTCVVTVLFINSCILQLNKLYLYAFWLSFKL